MMVGLKLAEISRKPVLKNGVLRKTPKTIENTIKLKKSGNIGLKPDLE